MRLRFAVLAAVAAAHPLAAAAAQPLSPYASAAQQQAAMTTRATTAEAITRQALARIAAIDRKGPRLNSVLAVNPQALADARALDAGRRAGLARGPLYGVPILIKDNIETAGPLATTAGSLAMTGNVTGRDAPVVARLRAAGAVILGKSNLLEWANFRSTRYISWSAVGGMVRNPYMLDRSACGSSAGSAVAVAAGIVPVAIGTETDGSITCPAAINGVVGLKPTVGLVSRTFIVPISPQQDTAGPMGRSVADVAAVLGVIAGSDPADPATREADAHKVDYVAALDPMALKGARIGVLRMTAGRSPPSDAVYEAALRTLRDAGAVLVEVGDPDQAVIGRMGQAEGVALRAEFKAAINAYLAGAPPSVKSRTLDELIAFNSHEPRETALFGQEVFEQSAKAPALTDPDYLAARETAHRLATRTLDGMMRTAHADALVALSAGPASVMDPVNGSVWFGSPSTLPAVAGYPHLTLPMGYVAGLPVGLSFIGPAWSEPRLLALGHAYERLAPARRNPSFTPTISAEPPFDTAYDPHQ